MGLTSIKSTLQSPNIYNISTTNQTCLLVKAHSRTEVYATVLARGRENVDVFQPTISASVSSVEARTKSSTRYQQHSSNEKINSQLHKVTINVRNRTLQPTAAHNEGRGEDLRAAEKRGQKLVIQRTFWRRKVSRGPGDTKMSTRLHAWPQRAGSGA